MQRARGWSGRLACAAWLAALGTAAGCHTTLSGKAMQPNPLAMPQEEVSRESKHIHIRVKDMDVPRQFQMFQTAWFSVISRDRLRFHVVLVHKWEEFADVSGWDAKLEDDRGRVYIAQDKEKRSNRFTTKVWDHEIHTARTNLFGDVVGTYNDGHRRRVSLDKVDLFKGSGDVVFYSRDIFDQDIRRLTLTLSRGGISYRFVWDLYDPDEPGAPVDDEIQPREQGRDMPIVPRGVESYGEY
jgi:hypothetical protein